MDPHFEDIMREKMDALHIRHHQEPALEGLDAETQAKAKTAILVCQLEFELHHLKLTDKVAPPAWMNELDEEKQQRVIAYFTSCVLDEQQRVAFTWYERQHRFRLERTFHPVASR